MPFKGLHRAGIPSFPTKNQPDFGEFAVSTKTPTPEGTFSVLGIGTLNPKP